MKANVFLPFFIARRREESPSETDNELELARNNKRKHERGVQ